VFISTLIIEQPTQEVLGIGLYLNFTTAYVPAEHRHNTCYIFLSKIYKCIFSTALSSCLYSAQFLSIQRSIPVYTALNSCLYSAQFLSIQRSIPVYTALNSCQYRAQFLSIQCSIPVNKTLNFCQYNAQFLSIKHSIFVIFLNITEGFLFKF